MEQDKQIQKMDRVGLTPLTKQTWKDVWQNLQVKATQTQFEILASPTVEISTINYGSSTKEPSILMMEAVLLMVTEYYGVEWSSVQFRETAELIVDEFWWLQIAEMKHFLTKVKIGHFGKLLSANQFTPPIFMGWLDQYANESWNIRRENGYVKAQSDSVNERTEPNNGRKMTDSDKDFHSEKIKQMQSELIKNMTDKTE